MTRDDSGARRQKLSVLSAGIREQHIDHSFLLAERWRALPEPQCRQVSGMSFFKQCRAFGQEENRVRRGTQHEAKL